MFELDHIARITGGTLSGAAVNCRIENISTDSRNIAPGELFIPLRGERFDGHDYLSQAVKNGAAACLSEEVVAGLPVPVLRVENTLRALGDIAAAHRLQLKGPLVAITGSAGKTTTKEMLAGILERVAPGLKTAGNYNNLIGLPLTLLRLRAEHKWAVVEMGTSALGEIERLTEIAQPAIGVLTNIGAAHLETLSGLDGVARAKGELLAGLRGGSAIINLDDPRVSVLPVANGVKKITYGLSGAADVRAEEVSESGEKQDFALVIGEQKTSVTLSVPGRHNVLNALAAAAVASELDVPIEEIAAGLSGFAAVSGRMSLYPMPCGGMLLDDSYNSNPLSAKAAIRALKMLKGQGRRIAVLGDMLELGPEAPVLHQELGRDVVGIADLLVAVGDFGEAMQRGASGAGLPAAQIVLLGSAEEAAIYMQNHLRSGDRILVKGSRGVHLEKVVEALMSADFDAVKERGE